MPWIGPGPDDRDLDDEIVEALRPGLRQRLHLGPALDLEDPDRVGRLEHLEDLGDLLRQPVEVDADRAVVLDQLERLVDRGEHPEPEQVELDQLELLDVALVELDDDPVRHRRPLDRGDVDERRGRDEHAARVDRQVAREPVDPGAELQPALPVGEVRVDSAERLGRRLRLDARDRRSVATRPGPSPPSRGRRVPAARPAEAVGGPRRRLGLAALRVDLAALDEGRRHQPVALRLVPRPLPRPQPGHAITGYCVRLFFVKRVHYQKIILENKKPIRDSDGPQKI